MKKLVFILSALLLVASCGGHKYSGSHGEKTQMDAEAEFNASLSDAQRSEVLDMAEDFMSKLKAGQLEEAVSMIYVLHDDVLYKKSSEYTQQLISRFRFFPVLSYTRNYYSFSTEGNNDISYTYEFTEGTDEKAPDTMKLMFNPVYVDGTWYLTFKDGSQSSKDLPVDKQIHELAPAPKDIRLNKQ